MATALHESTGDDILTLNSVGGMSAVWDWRRSSTTDNVLSLRDHVRVLPAFPLSVDEEPDQDANEHAARHQDSPTLAGSTDLGTQKLRTQADQHVRISFAVFSIKPTFSLFLSFQQRES